MKNPLFNLIFSVVLAVLVTALVRALYPDSFGGSPLVQFGLVLGASYLLTVASTPRLPDLPESRE